MLAAVQEGEPVPRFRQAREDDKFLVAKDLEVSLPPFTASDGTQFASIRCRMMWSVKSKDLHIELTETNLRYIFAALECSEREEKKEKGTSKDDGQDAPRSPRKRRRLKRRQSQEANGAEAEASNDDTR